MIAIGQILCRFGFHKTTLPSPLKRWHVATTGVWVYCSRCGRAGVKLGPGVVEWGKEYTSFEYIASEHEQDAQKDIEEMARVHQAMMNIHESYLRRMQELEKKVGHPEENNGN